MEPNLVKPNQNLDCIYHFSINSTPNRILFNLPNQSEKCNYNPNLGWVNKIQEKFIFPIDSWNPGKKKFYDQAYSCLRDLRLSA